MGRRTASPRARDHARARRRPAKDPAQSLRGLTPGTWLAEDLGEEQRPPADARHRQVEHQKGRRPVQGKIGLRLRRKE